MSISLTVTAEDAEVESLLNYLNVNHRQHVFDNICLLERTIKWLKANDPTSYGVTACRVLSPLPLVDDRQQASLVQCGRQPAQPQDL
jgi:hypothetical protein